MTASAEIRKKDRIIKQLQQDNHDLRLCIGSLKSRLNIIYAYLEIKHDKKFRNWFKLKKAA